jgi:DNA-binding NarL/FixJ family response regulator
VISVVLADDQAVVRDGLRVILEAQGDIKVVAEASDGVEAVEHARRSRPDVVVMDIRMPRLDGIEATSRLVASAETSRVLVLTTFGEDEYVYRALRAGASGFVLKDAERAEIVNAVRAVAAGDQVLSPTIIRRVIEQFVGRRPAAAGIPPELAELTPRELEVARFVANGLSNVDIAERLVLSVGTVKSHIAHILQKLQLTDRVQVVVLAYECGLVQAGANVGRDGDGRG